MNNPNEHKHREDASYATLSADLADKARAFQAAAAEIDRRAGEESSAEASPRSPGGALKAWARDAGVLIPVEVIDSLPVVSNSTSEHEVHYRDSDNRAVKRTWAGVYGQIPVPMNGKLERRNATPSEYLRRMFLQILVFQSDLKLEGVTISDKPPMVLFQPPGEPSIVISQPWFGEKGAVTTEAIEALLQEAGFREVPGSYFGWFRSEDGVVIVDAKPDNFINTPAGLVPIDLQMAQFSIREMELAGLSAG